MNVLDQRPFAWKQDKQQTLTNVVAPLGGGGEMNPGVVVTPPDPTMQAVQGVAMSKGLSAAEAGLKAGLPEVFGTAGATAGTAAGTAATGAAATGATAAGAAGATGGLGAAGTAALGALGPLGIIAGGVLGAKALGLFKDGTDNVQGYADGTGGVMNPMLSAITQSRGKGVSPQPAAIAQGPTASVQQNAQPIQTGTETPFTFNSNTMSTPSPMQSMNRPAMGGK
jgi:hypothetical protein